MSPIDTAKKGPPTWRRGAMAVGWMLVGSALVFGLMLAMNLASDPPPKQAERAAATFHVEKIEQKQKMKVRKQRPPRKRPARSAARAPLPQLGAGPAGRSCGVPDFDASQVGGLSSSLLGDMANLVMTEDAVDTPPRVRSQAPVVYPSKARSQGLTGSVTLSLLIDGDGKVRRVKVLEADPAGVFEDAAVTAVRDWTFEPARYRGEEVKVWVRQTLNFKLI